MLGSDAHLFILTNVLIVSGVLFHLLAILPRSPHTATAPTYTFVTVIFLLTQSCLWLAAATDPGIIPPVSSPTRPHPPSNNNTNNKEEEEAPVGSVLGYRFCSTCNIF